MKKLLTSMVVALLAFSTMALPVFAAEIAGGEEFVFPSTQVVNDDYYVGGALLNLSGKVMGDLVAGGAKLVVEGVVDGDLLAAGGEVDILGTVADDVRVAGGEVTISGNIAGDLVVAGGTVNVLPGSIVQGDVLVAAGEVSLNGLVNGDVNMVGGSLSLTGTVHGNIDADLEDLRLGDGAFVGGNINYTSTNEMEVYETATVVGEVNYTQVQVNVDLRDFISDVIIGVYLMKFLIALVGALLLALLLNKGVTGIVNTGMKSFWMSLLIGFGVLLLMPIVGIILLVTVLGMPLGFVALLLYVVWLIIADILAGVVFGSWLFKVLGKGKKYLVDWKRVVVGVFLLTLLGAIPVIGWFLSAAFFLVSLGAVVQFMKGHVMKEMV